MERSIFKAYDVRGLVPHELDAAAARTVAEAFAMCVRPARVAIGRDARVNGVALFEAVASGLSSAGCDVLDLGLAPTEVVTFAAAHLDLDGAIVVTGSHNPAAYNGLKLLGPKGRTLRSPSSLQDIRQAAERLAGGELHASSRTGRQHSLDLAKVHIDYLLECIDPAVIRPIKIVADCGGGMAGPTLRKLLARLPQVAAMLISADIDGSATWHVPNPLLQAHRTRVSAAVVETGADLGVAWDGDADRCFLFDHQGRFVSAYELGCVLAAYNLRSSPGATVVHDLRLEWNTRAAIARAGGRAVRSRCGYTFLREAMVEHDAVFGAEASGHFYFREFYSGDSGMLPLLQTLEQMGRTGASLVDLVREQNSVAFACEEMNLSFSAPAELILEVIAQKLGPSATEVLQADGISLQFPDWRCNIRCSNTEPVVRVNVEATSEEEAIRRQSELVALIENLDRLGATVGSYPDTRAS